ncbi:hypothetical protein RE6C_00733 [Rhodopirellula europaea 6C]|uniref:Uncharacterized protein n=1 Tax=Rhodopirellula europaea 6C TaxID=1263867 RepID=M2B8R5_9BACT|nr:hypothetical protein RE6C_00733 [Rhodopirellula europaea 6C]
MPSTRGILIGANKLPQTHRDWVIRAVMSRIDRGQFRAPKR